MKELLSMIAKGLVDEPDQVTVEVDDINEEGVIVFHLHVAPDDMGRVIGKQGRIAKAIRTVMRATANRADSKILVEIDLTEKKTASAVFLAVCKTSRRWTACCYFICNISFTGPYIASSLIGNGL